MFENKHNITNIRLYFNSHQLCELGEDWYTINFTIDMEPSKWIPDYRDIKTFVEAHLDGKKFTAENAMKKLSDFMMSSYYPYCLKIEAEVGDSNHPRVIVTSETYGVGGEE